MCRPIALALTLFFCGLSHAETLTVSDDASLRGSLQRARPGDTIRIQPGAYRGNLSATLHGTKDKPITIEGDRENLPLIQGGDANLHLPGARFVTLRNLRFQGAKSNGINIDDAGKMDASAVGINLENIHVFDVGPTGNHDGIKLSGLADFTLRNCTVEGWGGSAIDMVGCHNGVIERCTFRAKDAFQQDTGVQLKGGSASVAVRDCRFDRAGGRAINCGGSTGLPYFRPRDANYEARDITIERNIFRGSQAPVAFVGVDGAIFRDNTIYHPERWVLRILQESTDSRFIKCRNVVLEGNLIVYRSADVRAIVNIGPNTQPETFTFKDNWWWCGDGAQSKPQLPTREINGRYDDPKLKLDNSGFPIEKPGARAK